MIWEILEARPFLDSWLFVPDDAAADQVDALGPMPDEWWEAWQGRSKRFVENGKPKEGTEVWTFDQRFEDAIQAPRGRKSLEAVGGRRAGCFLRDGKGYACFPAWRVPPTWQASALLNDRTLVLVVKDTASI